MEINTSKIIFLSLLMVLFQNCGKSKFEPIGDQYQSSTQDESIINSSDRELTLKVTKTEGTPLSLTIQNKNITNLRGGNDQSSITIDNGSVSSNALSASDQGSYLIETDDGENSILHLSIKPDTTSNNATANRPTITQPQTPASNSLIDQITQPRIMGALHILTVNRVSSGLRANNWASGTSPLSRSTAEEVCAEKRGYVYICVHAGETIAYSGSISKELLNSRMGSAIAHQPGGRGPVILDALCTREASTINRILPGRCN